MLKLLVVWVTVLTLALASMVGLELKKLLKQQETINVLTQKLEAAYTPHQNSLQSQAAGVDYGHPQWLHECREFFFDVGANIGTHGRRMFEPEKYKDSTYVKVFDDHFGPAAWRAEGNSSRCILGLEANPKHMPRLREVEAAYLKQDWKVHYYHFAAWKSESTMLFDREPDDAHSDWAGHLDFNNQELFAGHVHETTQVRAIDFNDFVNDVLDRASSGAAVRLMKMDIEGAEYEVLQRMMTKGTLCKDVMSMMTFEAHTWGARETWGGAPCANADECAAEVAERVRDQPACRDRGGPTDTNYLDDESYLLDGQPLP